VRQVKKLIREAEEQELEAANVREAVERCTLHLDRNRLSGYQLY